MPIAAVRSKLNP